MRDFQTRRRPTVVTVLTSSGSAFFWGVSIAVALKADVPRRVRALYRSQVGVPVQDAGAGSQGNLESGRGDGVARSLSSERGGGAVGSGQDAAGTRAPGAQRLVPSEREDRPDRGGPETAGAPGKSGAADAGSVRSGPVESAKGGPARQPGDSGSASGSANTGPMPGIVAEDQDAVRGDGTTQCPEGFPIKGNGRSRLYHMPEGSAYARTKPEVCFRTPEAAERAGFRRAKG